MNEVALIIKKPSLLGWWKCLFAYCSLLLSILLGF